MEEMQNRKTNQQGGGKRLPTAAVNSIDAHPATHMHKKAHSGTTPV